MPPLCGLPLCPPALCGSPGGCSHQVAAGSTQAVVTSPRLSSSSAHPHWCEQVVLGKARGYSQRRCPSTSLSAKASLADSEALALRRELARLREKSRRLVESWSRVRRVFNRVEVATVAHTPSLTRRVPDVAQEAATAVKWSVTDFLKEVGVKKRRWAVVAAASAFTGLIVGLFVGLGTKAPQQQTPVPSTPGAQTRVTAPAGTPRLSTPSRTCPDPSCNQEPGPLGKVVALVGRDFVAFADAFRDVARSVLQAFALVLGLFAVLLPLLGQVLQGVAFVLTPVFQFLLMTLADLLRLFAAKAPQLLGSTGSTGVNAEQVQGALDSFARALEVIAGTTPQVESALQYTAGKALPVVQATMVATSEIASDVSNL